MLRLQELPPGRRETSALRGDPHRRRRRLVRKRLLDGADDGNVLIALADPLGVEDGDDRVRGVVDDAPHRLPVVRVAGLALSED